MSVAYERTGGFAGIRQRLELDLERKELHVTDRHGTPVKRAVSAEELSTLHALLAAVDGQQPPPPGGGGRVSDGFTLQLWLGGAATPAVVLHTLSVPLGKGEGSAWGKLLSFVDGLLTRELEGSKPKGAPKLLSPDDLEG